MNRNNFFNEPSGLFLAVVYVIFGLVVSLFGQSILLTAVRVFGGAILVYGIWQLVDYFRGVNTQTAALIIGIAGGIVGLILLLNPAVLVSVFPTLVGAVLVFNGIFGVFKGLRLKNSGLPWAGVTIASVVLAACGLFLMFSPMTAVSFVFRVCGILLIIQGVVIFFDFFTHR